MKKLQLARFCLFMFVGLLLFSVVYAQAGRGAKPGTQAKDEATAVSEKAERDMITKFNLEREKTVDFLKQKSDAKFIDIYRDSNNATRRLYNRIYEKHPDVKTIPLIKDREAAMKKYSLEIKQSHPEVYKNYIEADKKMLDYLLKSNPRLKQMYEQMTPEQQAQL